MDSTSETGLGQERILPQRNGEEARTAVNGERGNQVVMAQALRKMEPLVALVSRLHREIAPVWQTETFVQAMKRGGLRGRAIARIAEPALLPELPSPGSKTLEGWDSLEWEPHIWDPGRKDQRHGSSVARVATFARRLMAIERARVLHRKGIMLGRRALAKGNRSHGETRKRFKE